MAAKTATVAGTVQNPRGIPDGVAILSQVISSETVKAEVNGVERTVQTVVTAHYFAGETVTPADLADWDGMVARGFVKVNEG